MNNFRAATMGLIDKSYSLCWFDLVRMRSLQRTARF